MVVNFFGDLFDFNGDGESDAFEIAAGFGLLQDLMESSEADEFDDEDTDF